MNQPQEARRAATQAFFEALEQLHQSLETDDESCPNARPANPAAATTASDTFDNSLNAWEEAIADIEQFMQELSAQDP